MKPIVLGLALALTALVARPAQAQMPSHPAFMMEARVGGGLAVAGNTNGGGGASAELAFGVRLIDRLQIGLGFTVLHLSGGGVNNNFAVSTIFTFNPQLTIDILKAHDNKVAWYGKIGLPVGAQTQAISTTQSNTVFVIGYDLGFGVRYCPHPNFAFGAEGGVNGFYVDPSANGGTGTTGVYGAVVGTFYWGKS